MEIFELAVLSISGLLLSYGGIVRLVKPIKSLCLKTYLDNPELKLESEVDLFNEMRGAGAVTLIGGLVVILGTIMPHLKLTSFVVAVVIFLGYAVGRLISLGADGKPNKDLIQGTIAEIVLSAFNIFCLVRVLVQG